MKSLEIIKDYICSKENIMLTRQDIQEIYGKEFVENILEEETRHLCDFFEEGKEYKVPFNDFVLLSMIFNRTKMNYRDMSSALAFVLNKNAKLIESLSEEKLVSYTFLANGMPINNEEEKEMVIQKFKIAPSIIRKYINEEGKFLPVNIEEIDKEQLNNLIFILSEEQINMILFFCQKEYDKQNKSKFIIKEMILNEKNEEQLNLKEARKLRKELSNFIDNRNKLIRYLNEEELNELFNILELLKVDDLDNLKISIINQNNKLLRIKDEKENLQKEAELLEKFEEIKLECLNEHELLSYDYAMQILRSNNFRYIRIKEDIEVQINDINTILNEIITLKDKSDLDYEKNKANLIDLMSLSFYELYEILDNYHLIENSYTLERKKEEN